jgi:hypothetical protein
MQTIHQTISSEQELDDSLRHDALSHDDIAMLAYQFWEERGRTHGNHEEDWQRAEQQILQMREEKSTAVSHAA